MPDPECRGTASPAPVSECERQDDTLIVMPLGHSLRFAPGQVESQTAKVMETFSELALKNVVVDLKKVTLVDSIVLSSIITLATMARKCGGQAILCNVSSHALGTVRYMNLNKLMTLTATREDALAALK